MSEDILELNGISAWLASVVATKSLLCGFRRWRDEAPSQLEVIWTVKMIDRWNEITLQEMENHIRDNGAFWSQLPLWARETFSKRELRRINSLENHHNKATELHAALLAAASQALLNIAGSGAGKHNTSQIKLWFQSLKSAKTLSLFNGATQNTENCLDAITDQYNSITTGAVQENGAKKLYHDTLLVHIAHMVHFACTPPPQGSPRKIICSPEEYRQWSVTAGSWHARHLKLGSPGSCVGDVNNIDVNNFVKKEFAMIEVPIDQLIRCAEKSECPNVIALHQEILDRMVAAIEQSKQENPSCDDVGSSRFVALQQKAVQLLQHTNQKLTHSKKEFTHRLQNRNNDTCYEPRPPTRLMNDVFVMGEESYHLIFKKEDTPTKRKRDNDGTSACSSPYAKLGRLGDIPGLRL